MSHKFNPDISQSQSGNQKNCLYTILSYSSTNTISYQLKMLSQVSRRAVSVRAFSTSRIAFAAPPPSGKDSFKDRENAEETAYVRKHEAEQLAKLREELAKQKAKITELEESINKK